MKRNLLFLIAGFGLAGIAYGESLVLERARSQLFVTLRQANYLFTPNVRTAYLTYQKELAKEQLKEDELKVSKKFLAWIDTDPLVEATIYGTHEKPGDMVGHLFALGMELGRPNLEKYRQFALAGTVVQCKLGIPPDTTLREPITLEIGGDPRVPVDTKDPARTLDIYDHIINFLNENTIEGHVVNDGRQTLPELKYDSQGVAIPPPVEVVDGWKKQKQKRSLYACDVIASPELQSKFNAYMKAKGFPVDIDCGDNIIHWYASEGVQGEMRGKIARAHNLFKKAYEEKGLLPKERDPSATMGERLVYTIRNFEHPFVTSLRRERKWPRYPLTAPWPTMTILASDPQPLREREERWLAFRDHGTFITYGEYIGGVAQQYDMQSARRVCPFPFTYGSIQMMLKDGGVCGTMGNISARTHITLGIPSCTAGQPGHCAAIAFHYNDKDKTYRCSGSQYATGGDEKTTPHAAWFFGKDVRDGTHLHQKKMIYHQSIAFAMNYDFPGFLNAMMAYNIYHLLSEKERQERGFKFLQSSIKENPYSFLVMEAMLDSAHDALATVTAWQEFEGLLLAAKKKDGCPTDGLYNQTLMTRLFAQMNKLDVPTDRMVAHKVFHFLNEKACDNAELLIAYRLNVEGMVAVQREVEKEFRAYLAANQAGKGDGSEYMANSIKAVAESMKEGGVRKSWADNLFKLTQGKETFVDKDNQVCIDPSVRVLASLANKKSPSEADMFAPMLQRLSKELSDLVKPNRNEDASKAMASKIKSAVKALSDQTVKKELIMTLSEVIKGKENYKPRGSNSYKRDICADTLDELRAEMEG